MVGYGTIYRFEFDGFCNPFGTKLIYFVGHHNDSTMFYENGIDSIEEKDIDGYLNNKPKKTVGKPAVSNKAPLNEENE